MKYVASVRLLALLLASLVPTEASGESPAGTLHSSTETDAEFDLEKPIRDYLGPESKTRGPGAGRASSDPASRLNGRDVTVLIATLPDPIDSVYRYRFDFFYGAIQAAIEAAGYLPDRYILPWSGRGGPAEGSSKGEIVHEIWNLLKQATGKSKPDDLQERWPGLVLFRRANPIEPDREKLLFLLVVGETSTWGVHKGAMRKSLELRDKLLRAGAKLSPRVFVLGPTFSGSFASLIKSLGIPTRPAPPKFTVFSGSATGINLTEDEWSRLEKGLEFRTTVHNDRALMDGLAKYLKSRDVLSATPRKVALLVPMETAQGQTIARIARESSQLKEGVLLLPFPPHLSAARGTGDDTPDNRPVKTEPVGFQAPAPPAPLALREVGTSSDLVPPLNGSVTARSEALLLAKTLATISREDIRYVGIFSSDTRDTVFLLQLVERHCPDVQVFFNSNDILLTFPEYAPFVEGAVVASSYPLFSPSQTWDFPFKGTRRRLLFSNEFDQGIYNAALLLISRANGDNCLINRLIDYGLPDLYHVEGGKTSKESPPVWISVVGKNGPWPVAVMKVEGSDQDPRDRVLVVEPPGESCRGDDERGDGKAGDKILSMTFTLPWILAFTMASLTCLLFCHAYVTAFPYLRRGDPRDPDRPKWNHAHLAIVDYFRPVIARPAGRGTGDLLRASGEQRAYITLLFSVLLATYLAVAWPGTIPLKFALDRGGKALVPVALILAGLVVGVAGLLALARRRPAPRPWRTLSLLLVAALAADLYWLVRWYQQVMTVAVPAIAILTSWAILFVWSLNARNPAILKSDRYWFLAQRRAAGEAGLALAVIAASLWLVPAGADRVRRTYFGFQRTVHMSSGVSPTAAALFLGAGVCCWPLCQLRRLRLLSAYRIASPFDVSDGGGVLRRLSELDADIQESLLHPCGSSFRRPLAMAVTIAYSLFLVQTAYRMIPTVEGPLLSAAGALAFLLGSFLYLFVYLHSCRLFGQHLELLRQVSLLPIAGAYDRLPLKVSFTFGRFLSTFNPRLSNLQLWVQQFASLTHGRGSEAAAGDRLGREVDGAIAELGGLGVIEAFEAETRLEDHPSELIRPATGALGPATFRAGEVTVGNSRSLAALNEAMGVCLGVLQTCWPERPVGRSYRDPRASSSTLDAGPERRASEPERVDGDGGEIGGDGAGRVGSAWIDRAEEFVALGAVVYVSQFSLQLRNDAKYLTACPFLLLLAVNTYPFQPHRLLALYYWFLSLATLVTLLAFALKLDRDEFMSRVAKTRPAHIDWASLSVLLTYLVPLLGVLFTLYPDVSDFLFTNFGPLFRVFEK